MGVSAAEEGGVTNLPISIGDAVLVFSADTSQLDAAYTRINSGARSNLAPAQTEAQRLAQGLNVAGDAAIEAGAGVAKMGEDATVASADVAQLGVEMEVTSNGARVMGEAMTLAGEKTKFSMYEAKGEIGLVGEAIGVTLPRHVRSFIAELPGVGAALTAAFEATAILFIAEAIVEATKKLTEFISDTFIYTESMKEADKITAEMNVELGKNSEATKKLKDEYALLGLQGVAKTGEQMRLLQRDIDSTNTALALAKDKVNELRAAQADPSGKESAQADSDFQIASSKLKDLEQQRTNLAREAGIERTADAHKEALAQVEIEKERASSISNLKLQENRELAADEQHSNGSLLQIEATHQLELYNINLAALQRKLEIDKTDRTKDPGLVKQDLVKIEDLQRDHATALIKIFADTIQGINGLSLGDTGRIDIGSKLIGTDFQDKFQQAEDAANTLGITLGGTLAENVDKASEAYQQLKNSGVASLADIYQAQIKVLQGQIQLGRESGENTAPLERQLQIIGDEYDKLTGKIGRTGRVSTDYFRQFRLDLQRGAAEAHQFGGAMGSLFNSLTQGIQSAFAEWILGQKSLGVALREALAQVLANFAAQEAVQALIYTAEGFAALATFDGAAAANFFTAAGIAAAAAGLAGGAAALLQPLSTPAAAGGGGTRSTTAPNQATQTQQLPIQTINVQSLAGGGLISKKNLVMIGDSVSGGNQREVVLPLGQDDNALNEIAGRLVERLPGGGGHTHIYNIKGSLIDHNKLMREQSRQAKRGKGRLTVNNSYRVTRRG